MMIIFRDMSFTLVLRERRGGRQKDGKLAKTAFFLKTSCAEGGCRGLKKLVTNAPTGGSPFFFTFFKMPLSLLPEANDAFAFILDQCDLPLF